MYQLKAGPDLSDYKGSNFVFMMEWENGELTTALKLKARYDPARCAIFENENSCWMIQMKSLINRTQPWLFPLSL
jgi:hypothetical protein